MPAKIPARFTDATAARKHLEKLLWPVGPACPHCTSVNDATALKGKSTRPGVYWCNACQKPFTVTVGTVYERSKVPLNTWLYATHLLCVSKKGISSHQLARMLGVTYKTAWFMAHRIREAMAPVASDTPALGGEGKVVEADEAELGVSKHTRARKGGRKGNLKFVSLIERGGQVRSVKLTGTTLPSIEIHNAMKANIDPASLFHTDGAKHYAYSKFRHTHESVDHNKEFVREGERGHKVHNNSAEGYFSIFKRGLVGTYQHMSSQHLHRYLNEFDFRMNTRIALGVDDAVRADLALKGITGKRLTYRRSNEAANA